MAAVFDLAKTRIGNKRDQVIFVALVTIMTFGLILLLSIIIIVVIIITIVINLSNSQDF